MSNEAAMAMRDTEFDAISSTYLEAYLAQALVGAKYDLSSSYSDVLDLSILQNLASTEDFGTWENLDFGYTDPDGSATLRSRISRLYSALGSAHMVCCTGAHDAAACVAEALLTPGRSRHCRSASLSAAGMGYHGPG